MLDTGNVIIIFKVRMEVERTGQIIETIRLLVKPEDLPPVDVETQGVFVSPAAIVIRIDYTNIHQHCLI